jgi:ABC-type transporter Mla maintaining outer membrane lipid asymmetry ATPase subunit MlaF
MKITIQTLERNNLFLPQANLTIYQQGAYYSGLKIFNNLPLEIKIVADNQKKFKRALKKFVSTYTFYTMEEYLTHS